MGILDGLLNASISVWRKSPTKDASGGQVPGFAPVAELQGLPCSIQPKRGQAQVTLGQRQVFLTHHIYLDQDYGLVRGDKVVNDATGVSYIFFAILDMAGQGEAFRYDVIQET